MQESENERPARRTIQPARLNQIVLILAVFTIAMMCISLGAGYYAATRPTPIPTPTETVFPTKTPIPTPTKTEPPRVRATDVIPPAAYLPGLAPDDVVKTFMGYMFQCSDTGQTEAGARQWTCRQISSYATSEVRIISRSGETVDEVIATIKITEGAARSEEIGRFLSEAAALNYEGAAPRQAADWVKRKVPGLQAGDEPLQAVFGDVQFTLEHTAQGWSLTLGQLPQE